MVNKQKAAIGLFLCIFAGMMLVYFPQKTRRIEKKVEMKQFINMTDARITQASGEERSKAIRMFKTEVEQRCNIMKIISFLDGECVIVVFDNGERCFIGFDYDENPIDIIFEEDIPTYQETSFFQNGKTTFEEAEALWETSYIMIRGSFMYTTIHMVQEGMVQMGYDFSTNILQEWFFYPKDMLDGYWTEFYATVYAQMEP